MAIAFAILLVTTPPDVALVMAVLEIWIEWLSLKIENGILRSHIVL